MPALHQSTLGISLYTAVIAFILSLITGYIIAPFAFSIIPPDKALAGIAICLLLAVQPGISILASFHSALLQAQQRYAMPTIQLSLRSLGILPFVILPWCRTTLCLAVAFLSGEVVRLAVLKSMSLYRSLRDSSVELKTKALSTSSIINQAGWVALALGSSQINPIIDMAMVGELGNGSATLVNYAERLRGFPVLALSGLVVMYLGQWSRQHQKNGGLLSFRQVLKTSLSSGRLCSPYIVTCSLVY